jgi:hypothetical protein
VRLYVGSQEIIWAGTSLQIVNFTEFVHDRGGVSGKYEKIVDVSYDVLIVIGAFPHPKVGVGTAGS